tara:strand:- start:331 stop:996 length:666 start_codon:yes stop_codon:yes gene_type:complete
MIFALLKSMLMAKCCKMGFTWKIMNMHKNVIVTIISLLSFSTMDAKAETPPVNALSDGIAAFICDEIDNISDVPLIFINDEDSWSLSDFAELSVSKIENGFKFKSSGDEEGFGFLKKISRTQWDFEYLDEKGFYETSCISQDYFVDLLIGNISSKIIKNGDLLARIASSAKKALKKSETEKFQAVKRIEVLEKQNSNLRDQLFRLQELHRSKNQIKKYIFN